MSRSSEYIFSLYNQPKNNKNLHIDVYVVDGTVSVVNNTKYTYSFSLFLYFLAAILLNQCATFLIE